MTTPEAQYVVGLTLDQAKALLGTLQVCQERGAFKFEDMKIVMPLYESVLAQTRAFVAANPAAVADVAPVAAAQPKMASQFAGVTTSRPEKKPQAQPFLAQVE